MEEFITLNWWHLGIGLGALAVLAIVADWMKSRVIAKTLGRVASEAQISLDDGPFNRMVLRRLAPIVPALVVYYGIVPALGVTRSEVQAGAEAELGRSPVVFLSGVGALAAVLMLVFRNTLLSLAASIQITSNDIIRIGDWVEVPHANANGTVVDIDLHMVRVQNWDKTISTIPTHKLTGDSFKNWRAMSESGGRRQP